MLSTDGLGLLNPWNVATLEIMFMDVCFCSVINWIWLEEVSNVSYSHILIIFVDLV